MSISKPLLDDTFTVSLRTRPLRQTSTIVVIAITAVSRSLTWETIQWRVGGPPRTCAGSLQGAPPWGPATEQRFPVIDVERGLVFGITLLHYLKTPTPSQMYVSEVFKVVGGRIVRIDNIGLLMRGITSLGFVH